MQNISFVNSQSCPFERKSPIDLKLPIQQKEFIVTTETSAESENFSLKKIDENAFLAEGDIGTFSKGDIKYTIEEALIKSPSEHSIMGKFFEVEIQFFGKTDQTIENPDDNQTSVLIILAALGEPNENLSKIGFNSKIFV